MDLHDRGKAALTSNKALLCKKLLLTQLFDTDVKTLLNTFIESGECAPRFKAIN
jgi:hypothetical protein